MRVAPSPYAELLVLFRVYYGEVRKIAISPWCLFTSTVTYQV